MHREEYGVFVRRSGRRLSRRRGAHAGVRPAVIGSEEEI